MIARRFSVSEVALVAENGLRDRHHIAVGQRLRIPGAAPVAPGGRRRAAPEREPAVAAEPIAAAEPAASPKPAAATKPAAPPEQPPPSPSHRGGRRGAPGRRAPEPATERPVTDPSDYAVDAGGRITVQAAETLGHYAEWLEVKTSRLRHLNGLKFDAPVVIGRRTKLDFSRVTPETFESRRLAYHHSLQEEYFAVFEVTGTRSHLLQPGDSLWYLAERKYQVPIWLIRLYNPDVDLGDLRVGTMLVIPDVDDRTG